MDVVALAARIQAMPDDELDRLVVERQAPPQLGSTFDLAEHLMTDASIAQALKWRSAAELAALAEGGSTPRLEALLLAVDGVALFAGVVWQYAYWLPLVALPLMIVCVITLVILSATGRARRH